MARGVIGHDTVSLTRLWKYKALSRSRLALSWLRPNRSHYVFSLEKPVADNEDELAYNQSMLSANTGRNGHRAAGPGLSCSFRPSRRIARFVIKYHDACADGVRDSFARSPCRTE